MDKLNQFGQDIFDRNINLLKNLFPEIVNEGKIEINKLKELIGENRIVLGTDYPFPLGEKVPGSILEKADLGKKINDRIMKGNLLDMLID